METQNPEEKPLEFLKREDVRTMAKDIAHLREGEAKVERRHIEELEKPRPAPAQTYEKARPQSKPVLRPEAEPQPKELTQTSDVSLMPQKNTGLGKLFIRIVLVLVILFVAFNAFALVFWLSQKGEETPAPNSTQSENPQPLPLVTPDPVFPIASTEQIPLKKGGSVVSVLEEALLRSRPQGFTRMVIVLPEENRVWNVREFSSALGIQVPEQIQSGLQENLTLFIHKNSQNKQRVGFAIPLKEGAGNNQALKAWEPSLEQSLVLFLSFQGKKDSAAVSFFREMAYKGIIVRFQTFSSQDLGLVYAVANNALVVTGSLESMKAVIDSI